MIAIGLLIAAYLALCIGLAVFGAKQPAAGVEPTAQVVIVLGGGAVNGRLLPVGRARVAAGVASLGAGQSLHMTGGLAGGGSEAALMAAEAVRLGVDVARITQEGRSRTTQQNALFSASIVGNHPVVIVSDNFHLARAAMLFRGHGYGVVGLRGTTYRRRQRRALWFFAREGLSAPLNATRLIVWGMARRAGASREWCIRHLT